LIILDEPTIALDPHQISLRAAVELKAWRSATRFEFRRNILFRSEIDVQPNALH